MLLYDRKEATGGCVIPDLRPHNITVPLHNPQTGTLHAILSEVAQMRSVTIDSISQLL